MATTAYTSRRQYLSQSELAEYANITVTNTTEADDQISQAEEILDGYVGYQDKAISDEIYGLAASGTANTLTLEANRHQNVFQNNYFAYCEIEIVRGTGVGQRQIISASTFAGIITVVANWTTNPDSTSYYRIYQLGKFPRSRDQWFDGIHTPTTYVKNIPEAIKRATAAQVEYMIKQGVNFFATDTTLLQSEHIGDYSYHRSPDAAGKESLIAPKAKTYLRGYINRKGVFIPE